jgi:hypothetical protein
MMVGCALILTILRAKDKPVKFYFFAIFVYAIVLAIFVYDYTVLERLQDSLLDIQVLELARDLLMVSIIVQNVSLIWLGIRAAGFDIRSFHFNENLDELEIDESDNEEFEVDLDIDKNLYTRYFRRFKRFLVYMLKENKLVVTLAILIVLAISFYIIYLNKGVYEEMLQTNQAFQTNEFVMNIENSYYVESDYKGNLLEEDSGFVVLRIKVKSRTGTTKTLNKGRFALIVNGKLYYHTASYKEQLLDLGYSYANETIDNDFSSYLFVFKVPSSTKNTSMTLKYADTNNKEIKVDVTPLDLTKEREKDEVELGKEMVFTDSPLKDSTFIITAYDIQKRFKINYKYCYEQDKCYDSYEYVNASTSDNYAKSLLKLNGEVSISDSITIDTITTVYKFLKYFATIEYTVDGVNKSVTGEIKRVLPQKTENKNEYYIEVPAEMSKAEKIVIKFNIRNYIYRYRLK